MHSPFRRRPPRLAGPNLSPRQRRLAPLALLLLLVSLVLLALSRRTGRRAEVSSSTTRSAKSATSSSPSFSSSSSSLRLPPAVAAFHARIDDLRLGEFNSGVVAASLRQVLAGGEGAAASAIDDDDDDASRTDGDDKGAASSSRHHLPDPALTASFSALVRDIRASSATSPLPPLECDRDRTLPPLSSLRLKKEKGKEGGGGSGGGGGSDGGGGSERGGNGLELPRLLLAANLKDSAAVLPHWLLSALGTGARLPSRAFFLSVVESGSSEGGGGKGGKGKGDGGATRAWLSLLSRLASLAEVRAWVAVDAAPPRAPGTDRIRHLAALRNAALAPLWSRGPAAAAAAAARAELEARRRGAAAASAAVASSGAKESSSAASKRLDLDLLLDSGAARAAAEEGDESPSSTSTSVFSTPFAEANRVAFVNDVFFCPDDVSRLLAHTAVAFYVEGKREAGGKASSSSSPPPPSLVPLPVPAAGPADLACGLDLYRDARRGPLRDALAIGSWKGVPGEEILPWGDRGPPLDARGGGGSGRGARRRRRSGSNDNKNGPKPPPSPSPQHDSLLLYDVWVSRDANGLPLSARPPFARHQYSIDRAASGLPFPVACCWNGLAVFSAREFLVQEGGETPPLPPLRFRAASSGNESDSDSSGGSDSDGENTGGGSSNGGGDCPGSSECSLFCSDLHARGRWRAVLDPGVRVSYDARTAARALGDRKEEEREEGGEGASENVPIPSVPFAPWRRVRDSPPLDWGFAPAKFHLTCCPKGGKEDDVVHWEGCSWGGGVRPLERKG